MKINLPDSSARYLVGVSGGPDSVALLKAMTEAGYRCIACHCNFALRGEESEEQGGSATIFPTPDGTIATYSENVVVSTNNLTGYTLTSEFTSSDLTNATASTTIPSIANDTTESTFPLNQWGIAINPTDTTNITYSKIIFINKCKIKILELIKIKFLIISQKRNYAE